MNINNGIMIGGSQQSNITVNHGSGGGGRGGRGFQGNFAPGFNGNFNFGSFNRGPNEKILSSNLSYNPKSIVGKGSDGTRVFDGTFSGRKVAVKRIDIDNVDMGEREADLLLLGDEHDNIVNFYCTATSDEFFFIAMELCEYNLGSYFEVTQLQETKIKDVLRQVTQGVLHLHKNNIIHRDIKPQNILIKKGNDGAFKVKISDFGIGKELKDGTTTATMSFGNLNVNAWRAPETNTDHKSSKESDIYSLGCVFYFLLTDGKPLKGKLNHDDFGPIETSDEDLAFDIITKMLSQDPKERPSAEFVLSHGYFWDSKKILEIFANIIKVTEGDTATHNQKMIEIKDALNHETERIIYGNWKTKLMLDQPFSVDLREKRNKNLKGDCVFDLIKYIRNKATHLKDQTPGIQDFLGKTDEEFLKYWLEKFPKLLLHIYLQLLGMEL